jgi:hypothetical protein
VFRRSGSTGSTPRAYGPEAALTILIPAGVASLHAITPIMGAILVLLTLLFVPYWQTIEAYLSNGGAYTVASQNLGANAGLLAASALMIDFVLNVAVGISEKAVRYGMLIAPEAVAIHLTRLEGPDAEEHNGRLRRRWHDCVEVPAQRAGLALPKLELSPSPYRSFVGHLLKRIQEIEQQAAGRTMPVVIPELVKEHWWDWLLSTRRAQTLRDALMRHGFPNLAIVVVPWARAAPHPEKIIKDEEPLPAPPTAVAPKAATAAPARNRAKA